jgi:hypothetical protein
VIVKRNYRLGTAHEEVIAALVRTPHRHLAEYFPAQVVEGGQIEIRMRARGFQHLPCDRDEQWASMTAVLEAVGRLHELDWVHGDIRWPNIVFERQDSNWRVIDLENGAPATPEGRQTDYRRVASLMGYFFSDWAHNGCSPEFANLFCRLRFAPLAVLERG